MGHILIPACMFVCIVSGLHESLRNLVLLHLSVGIKSNETDDGFNKQQMDLDCDTNPRNVCIML